MKEVKVLLMCKAELLLFVCVLYTDCCMDPLTLTGKLSREILKSVGGLGFDKTLFLMDPLKVNTSDAPIFYKNIFKVWNLFNIFVEQNPRTLYWLLQEPLINGTRFDNAGNVSFLSASAGNLTKAGVTTLGHLINTAGPNFENLEETAVKLGIKSIRLVRQILTKWKSALLEEELKILADFCQGILKPNEEDSFYTLILSVGNWKNVMALFW